MKQWARFNIGGFSLVDHWHFAINCIEWDVFGQTDLQYLVDFLKLFLSEETI